MTAMEQMRKMIGHLPFRRLPAVQDGGQRKNTEPDMTDWLNHAGLESICAPEPTSETPGSRW
ncbi:hypothetical protein [Breoghania corrubedonensis]|uniref:hypothetical protein n=1 Tax=Breoghania corrubedonensis TaxID=665038 RepID=UPI000D36C2C0|nr:hypothetical protein [Breoghania corrubedonensis]